jgi:hypothetical protein
LQDGGPAGFIVLKILRQFERVFWVALMRFSCLLFAFEVSKSISETSPFG